MPRSLLGVLVVLVAAYGTATATAQPASSALDAALVAARHAVVATFGGDAEVDLSRPVLSMAPGAVAAVRAVHEPGSRSGGPVRFVLYTPVADGLRRVGRLTAVVRVRAPHVRTIAAVAARVRPPADALAVVRGDVGRQVFGRLPSLEVVGASTTRRALRPGEIVTTPLLAAPVAVVSGDSVVTLARVAGAEIRSRAIASQSGSTGEMVILVNPDSRKRLRGRVLGPALVEVFHGS